MRLEHQPGGTEWLIANGDGTFRVMGPGEKIIEHQGDQAKEYHGSQGEVVGKQK
jgi:hypothetical protein